MAGTVKIWWHDGAVRDVRYHDIPVVNEPELAFETLAVDVLPVSTSPAPANAVVAVIECDVNIRYAVKPGGNGTEADPTNSKPIRLTGLATDTIGVRPGDVISMVEV